MRRKISKHGRARFIERVGYMSHDDMLFTAKFGKPGFTFKWRPKGNKLVLVTVLITGSTQQCVQTASV